MLTINKLRRYVIHYYIYTNPEAYLEPRQTSNMERFVKIVNGLKLLTIFSENVAPNVWQGSKFASEMACKSISVYGLSEASNELLS